MNLVHLERFFSIFTTIPQLQEPKINQRITASKLRVIDAGGVNLGILSREDALARAQETAGMDLVEIAPQADPPVARIINYKKYRYAQEKIAKKERLAQKASGMKQIQISARAARHDLETQLHKLERFLEAGHQVEVQLKLRGREKYNKDWARQKLNEFLGMIEREHKLIVPPRFGGRGMIVQIVATHK